MSNNNQITELYQVTDGDVPDDRVIDVKDIWPLLSGAEGVRSPHEAIYKMKGGQFTASESAPGSIATLSTNRARAKD